MDNPSIRAFKACGFSEELVTAITEQSGFESIKDVGEQTEEDLRRLVKRIAADNDAPTFPLVSENRLLGIRYLIKNNERFKVDTTPGGVTLTKVKAAVLLRASHEKEKKEAEEKDENKADPFTDTKRWRTYESKLRDVLSSTYGDMHLELTYLLRDLEEPDTTATYPDDKTKRLMTAPFEKSGYKADQKHLFMILKNSMLNGPAWAHIKKFEKSADGRKAFFAARQTYMGASNSQSIVTAAETGIDRLEYHGNKKNLSFEKFASKLVDFYNDLETEGSQTFTEETKVNRLLIRVNDSNLEDVKTTIVANTSLMGDFEGCLSLFKTKIALNSRSKAIQNERKIAALNAGGGGRNGGRNGGRAGRWTGRGGRGGRSGRGNDNQGHPYYKNTWNRNGGGRDGGRGGGRYGRHTGRGRTHADYVPRDQWIRMSDQQRIDHMAGRRGETPRLAAAAYTNGGQGQQPAPGEQTQLVTYQGNQSGNADGAVQNNNPLAQFGQRAHGGRGGRG